MYKMLIFFLLMSSSMFAHQPDISSTMLIEKSNGQWVLQVRSALTAFEYEIKYSDSKNDYSTPEEFQKLVVDHIKDHVKLSFNGNNVLLDEGLVKLGHETSAVFKIAGTYEQVKGIEIEQTSFSKINKNRSAFIVMKDGAKPQQFVLDKNNNHFAKLHIKDGLFINEVKSDSEPIDTSHNHYGQWALFGLGVVLIAGLLYKYGFRK